MYICAVNRKGSILIGLGAIVVLFALNLMMGKIKIPVNEIFAILWSGSSEQPAWQHIILQSRLPQAITALFAGASLAASGLLLQTLFRNPLAGPSILGISDGANLGVALVMLLVGNSVGNHFIYTFGGSLAIIIASFTGACLILGLIIFFSNKVSTPVMLLIIGLMIGYLASSAISILNYYSSADRMRAYVMWGMGDFSAVTNERLPFFVIASLTGLILSILLIKPLNALLLGEMYAANLGVHIKRTRLLILLCTGLLIATVTAFCGPISFIGLAVPHIARLLLGTSNHSRLLPLTIILGACIALICNVITILPGSDGILPLNAVTPLIGAPVIIYVIINRKNIQYFN
ncbi:MAG: iron ABC transporter permease [Tannerella sp.]|nr:iron ABC transporter permease [Tannerella sp.]